MSIVLFSISSSSVLAGPGTSSDSNDGHIPPLLLLFFTQPLGWSRVSGPRSPGTGEHGVNQLDNHVHHISVVRGEDNLAY